MTVEYVLDPAAGAKWWEPLRRLFCSSGNIFIHEGDAKIFKLEERESMATNSLIHALADRLEVPKLARAARNDYLQAGNRLIEAGTTTDFVEDFTNSVRVVYQTTSDTDRRLRDITLFACQERLKTLQKSVCEKTESASDGLLLELLRSTPEFALELLKIDMRRTLFWCVKCQKKSSGPGPCICGMRGICGQNLCFLTAAWIGIRCTHCKKSGSCRKATAEDLRP